MVLRIILATTQAVVPSSLQMLLLPQLMQSVLF
jgi:hypothetical protein